ncbi:MAG: hypothetical protein ABSC48_07250 [Terracidiphilus sp.]|jgi:hypothetical protein
MSISNLNLIQFDRLILPGEQKQRRTFLDFCVDGISLYERFANKRDLVSTIWVNPPVPEEAQRPIKRLLKLDPSDFPNDRVAIYVCPECGDLGCGAISIEIVFDDTLVTWQSFGYENNYDNSVEYEGYLSIGPYSFDRIAYENLFRKLLS